MFEHSELGSSEVNLALRGRLSTVESFSLAAATAIAGLNVFGWLEPPVRNFFRGGSMPMSPESAWAVILSALSLQLFRPGCRFFQQILAFTLVVLVIVGSAIYLIRHLSSTTFVTGGTEGLIGDGTPSQIAVCFLVAAVTILLIRKRGGPAGWASDIFSSCFVFLVSVLVSSHLMGFLPSFGPTVTGSTSPQTLLCLVLLLIAVIIRRAECGLFSILLRRGIGSNVARLLAPLLILLPYFREGLRAQLFNLRRMPPQVATALLATTASAISMLLLMYLAWRLNALQSEIQSLSLRDPLTGLNNLRGFRLFSEQALLLAYRSGQPFSVLYIDVDYLKQINDTMGHQMGSKFLTTTGNLLREVFRETDVLARIGGDEFAVAGQFSQAGISEAVRRLRGEVALRDIEGTSVRLSLSLGWVTSDSQKRELLGDLLARADEEMYKEKRSRKESARMNPERLLQQGQVRLSNLKRS